MPETGVDAMTRQFLRFAVVGTIGFIVDAGVLLYLLSLEFGLYTARAVSFFFAVTCTWLLNRVFTFRDRNADLIGQWTRFASVNLVGGLINYGTYAALVWQLVLVQVWPVLGVAAGSISGMFFNFALSRWYVFEHSD